MGISHSPQVSVPQFSQPGIPALIVDSTSQQVEGQSRIDVVELAAAATANKARRVEMRIIIF
jgi:hypothetical protein